MRLVDKFILYFFIHLDRDSILSLIVEEHNILSAKWLQQKWFGSVLHCLSREALFTLIHQKKLWGASESVSGPGSTMKATQAIRNELPILLNKFKIASILDIPCGDFNWMKHADLRQIDYTGAEIVKALVDENNDLFGNQNRKFVLLDIVKDNLPERDLILCRDCLVHLDNHEVSKALQNIKNSGSKFLLTTTFPNQSENIKPGKDHWRPINLQKKPFNLPPPVLLIREDEEDHRYADKSLGLWSIKDL